MLAKIEPAHADFFALARYLIEGNDRPTHPDRVAWMFAKNIPVDDDPMLAAKIMAATAELSARCSNPCYHMSINWEHAERPSPEIMQEIARRTLELAGLDEHQAFVMGHGDKAHPHLHMMINRVHPETGGAWSTSHDYRRFDRIMKQLADDYGFQHVPCHAFDREATREQAKGPNTRAYRAAMRGADTSRPQWSQANADLYSARISEHLDRGSSFYDIEALFAGDGLTLEPKGKGWVVGDAHSYVKLSALGFTVTANGLTKRRSPSMKRMKGTPSTNRPSSRLPHSIFSVDAVDIARALGDPQDIRSAVQEAVGQRKARLAKAPLVKQLMEELKEQLKTRTGLSSVAARSRPRSKPLRRRLTGARDR